MKGFAAKRAGREGFTTVGHSDAALGGVRPWGSMSIFVVHGGLNALPTAEVWLGRLRRTPDARCEPLDTRFAGVLADHVRDCRFRQTGTQAFPFVLTRRNSLPAVRFAA